MRTTVTRAPQAGPTQKIQWWFQWLATTAGPKARAGFMQAPDRTPLKQEPAGFNTVILAAEGYS